MNDVARALAVSRDGSVQAEPLRRFGFRYDATNRTWRRVVKFHVKMPRHVARATVAVECGVADSLIVEWEAATHAQDKSIAEPAVCELLSVGSDGPKYSDPLVRWGLRFYPSSGVWRRTRADRNEVERDAVARKVGAPLEMIFDWERAMLSQCMPGQTGIAEAPAGPA